MCACCKLPVSVRSEIARRAKAGDSLTSISEHLISEGHGIGRAGVTNHVRKCLAIEEPDGSDPLSRSVLMARTIGHVLRAWPSKLQAIADALSESGLTVEAHAVLAADPDHMRRALAATDGSPASELLAARALGLACARVLGTAHPQAARDIAAAFAAQGADVLAADLLHLADLATKNRQPEGSAAGSAPPAASDKESA